MADSNKKTFWKTVSWEVFHFSVVAGIIYVITGEWEYAGLGGLVYIGLESAGYYIHERLWARFGKLK